MGKLKKLKAKKTELLAKMEAVLEAADDGNLTDEQQTEYDKLMAEHDQTVKAIENLEKLEAAKSAEDRPAQARKRVVDANELDDKFQENTEAAEKSGETPKVVLPASAQHVPLTVFNKPETAYGFGMYIKASLGDDYAKGWCAEHGVTPKWVAGGQTGEIDADGGFLVPDEYSGDILSFLNSYGTARQECHYVPMKSDTKKYPKRATGLTAHYVGQGSPGTKSKKTWGQIVLTAKDAIILTSMTNDLSADALISVADDLAMEIVYQFTALEDMSLFNGDGTATYKGIVGIYKKLEDTNRFVLAAGHSVEEVLLAECRKVISKMSSYALRGAKWHVSPTIKSSVFDRLMDAAGGNNNKDIANGSNDGMFLGYPVKVSDACNTDGDADGAIIAVFGNLKLAADFGDRQQVKVNFSESAVINGESMFERNETGVRGIERHDILVHSEECLYGLALDTVA